MFVVPLIFYSVAEFWMVSGSWPVLIIGPCSFVTVWPPGITLDPRSKILKRNLTMTSRLAAAKVGNRVRMQRGSTLTLLSGNPFPMGTCRVTKCIEICNGRD